MLLLHERGFLELSGGIARSSSIIRHMEDHLSTCFGGFFSNGKCQEKSCIFFDLNPLK